ncbi:MAG: Aldehyde Dehydrogenase [Candidatus Eremiobacteraeota bacterium]|nr:Aldehyde Dehydrogenase [Candidatus Eremiobacteraeota bacterium]
MTTTASAVVRYRAYIDGAWCDGDAVDTVTNPYDGRVVGEVVRSTPSDAERAVVAARKAFASWRLTPAFERAALVAAIAAGVEARRDEFAHTMCLHTGKPVRDGLAEVTRTVATLQIAAEEAKRIDGEVIAMDAVPAGRGKRGYAVYEPLGVVAGIVPYNAPLNLAAHKLGPALAAGDALVIKPHPQGSGVATMLVEIAEAAGVPRGVVSVVHGGADVGRALTGHSDVALISFTGSGGVAEAILRDAGLKRSVLELGGNAPTIVHEDADWERAAELCVDASFGLSGQTCVSTQRLYVHEAVLERFTDAFVARVRALRVGDPLDPATEIGPLNTADAAQRVHAWIREAVEHGARLLCGGELQGNAITPTVLHDVKPAMKVVCEEVFGPVVSILSYRDLDDVIRAANATPYGLKAGIFTDSLGVATRAARDLQFGTVNINAPSRSRVDHEPSGGVKASGWGREGPYYAIREFSNLKMVTVAGS